MIEQVHVLITLSISSIKENDQEENHKVVTELIKYILNNIISNKYFQVMLLVSIIMSIKLSVFHQEEVYKCT